jgi:hypothetical protein
VTVERPCSARRSTTSSVVTPGWNERAPSPTSAAQSAHRSAGAPPRGTRRRAPFGRQGTRRPGGDRARRHRRAPAPGRSHRAGLADSQRAPHRRARQPGTHQPRDRPDHLRDRTHGRGSPRERLPQAAGRLARRASCRTDRRRSSPGLVGRSPHPFAMCLLVGGSEAGAHRDRRRGLMIRMDVGDDVVDTVLPQPADESSGRL